MVNLSALRKTLQSLTFSVALSVLSTSLVGCGGDDEGGDTDEGCRGDCPEMANATVPEDACAELGADKSYCVEITGFDTVVHCSDVGVGMQESCVGEGFAGEPCVIDEEKEVGRQARCESKE